MKEWYSAAELAPLFGISVRAVNKKADDWRSRPVWHQVRNPQGVWRRAEEGNGYLYHYAVLPGPVKAKLIVADGAPTREQDADRLAAKRTLSAEAAWDLYARATDKKKEVARQRLAILQQVDALFVAGTPKNVAVSTVCALRKVGTSTYWLWEQRIHGVPRQDWLPMLIDHRAGRQAEAECHPEAWEYLKSDWLRDEAPTFTSCYRRLEEVAKARGWAPLPSAKTLERRLEALPLPVKVLARQGMEALKDLYPAQERNRGHFHALEAVNADGHKWDVFVQWPDGEILRPQMVCIQDLYSNMILAWRVDKSANNEAVRLAIGDMVEQWGIPDKIWFDNGRDFASKWITGGTPNRYRFKVREEEPLGILTQLGVEVHWTMPYSGQSKPIERAFKDIAGDLAKHPAFAGAYTGNKPDAKPESYGSRAVPLETFLTVVSEGIREHNMRRKRRTAVCGGVHSFLDVFQASYAQAPIRKASGEQRRLWLMAAEKVKADAETGAVWLADNRYHAEFLFEHRGRSLVVRFDGQNLHEGVHVYRQDGGYLGVAECVLAAGFDDVTAAKEHARLRRQFIRATRDAAAAERRLTPEEVAAMLPQVDQQVAPETKVVRPLFGSSGNAALAMRPQADPDAMTDDEFSAALSAGVHYLRPVPAE
ncbi:transposase domain-containing protein [Nitrospirillum amazonense]|uniref:transposase domain-containing protein n=1 Tax=Nitrospirillum amazonense TaxID=28077 RepID=UPI0024124AFF|nr:transposase domain-containing protein [Nitrospirillum amazonense]MDG3444504.1 transposase domain-containing protein [Nitrospirillum amazonense]